MIKLRLFSLCVVLVGAGCNSTSKMRQGATVQGAPRSPVEVQRVLTAAYEQGFLEVAGGGGGAKQTVQLPNQITVPGTYRQVLVDGSTMLVRETDQRQALVGNRFNIISGDVSRGDLSFQPALLESELAAELVRQRAATAEMDESSLKMAEQAQELLKATQALARKQTEIVAYAEKLRREPKAVNTTKTNAGTTEVEK